MKNTLLIVLSFCLTPFFCFAEDDWGQNGHRAVAEIAFQYLDEDVKQKILDLLDGESLATASTFADEIKSDKKYDAYKVWHYVNIPLNSNYNEAEKNEDGDLIIGIQKSIAILKDETSAKNTKQFHLKILIHLIGDLHQPFHVGLKEDRGGNDFDVFWFGEHTNIHKLWDTQLIESYNMSYTELATNKFPFREIEVNQFKEKTLLEWLAETHKLTNQVYASALPNENLSYAYTYKWFPVLRQQLHKAGIHLAAQLNKIFKI
ncbi:S1/P1 nuclease [Psychroflexus salis]|uniref:Endonuclease n=1 Tax=Psychroflexus salis TaxID=1526574 RepID=A0A916ZNI2_9FLAO|nr:S1/P1 nuclease [Psychroflexus salis]GGE06244.1 endonuclease [Psychroflexus salis]